VTVSLSDVEARRAQYAHAVSQWQSCPITGSRVVLVDNSGEELTNLVKSEAHRVGSRPTTLIAAPAPGDVAERGKGAAEAAMIDYAISCLDDLDENDVIFKVTGRLFVRNVHRVIPIREGRSQICVRATLDWSWVDTRFFGASVDVWRQHLRGMAMIVDERERVYLEHIVARRAMGASWSGVEVKRFRRRPAFAGQSATTGHIYANWRAPLRHLVSLSTEALLRHIPSDKQF
jgi:hypothetical protein